VADRGQYLFAVARGLDPQRLEGVAGLYEMFYHGDYCQEALVENQVVALTPADDVDLKTLGHLTVALLKHPPGFDGLAEKTLQVQGRLLLGITGNIYAAAACDAEDQCQ